MIGDDEYDLIVIGSGGGAFAAAIRARDLGASVVMVERATIGGTCVNVGCVPSKALLIAAASAHATGEPSLAVALERKRALVSELRQAKYVDLIDDYGIDYRAGSARLRDGHTVEVDGTGVRGGAIVIATGARPAIPDIAGLHEAGFLTSTSALELSVAPPRLAVLGTGAVGLELGQMLGRFGSRVTFVARGRFAPDAEPEISDQLADVLRAEGHEVLVDTRTVRVRQDGFNKVLLGSSSEGEFELHVDEILIATGRTPNVEDVGLDRAGVTLDENRSVVVDDAQRTSVASVFAAGDVTCQPRFVYVAAAAGVAAAENALASGDARLDFRSLPRVVFTYPAVARAGLTEAKASEEGLAVETRVLPLSAVPRALVNGDTRGLVKLVAEAETGRLLGASMLAGGAPDAIQTAVLAIERGLTVGELASCWAPYLTMAEGIKLAAQTFTRDVTKLSCCAA